MKRIIIATVTALAVALAGLLGAAPATHAGTGKAKTMVKSCDNNVAGFAAKATFNDPGRKYGTGVYRVKKSIKWGGAAPYNSKVGGKTPSYRVGEKDLRWDFRTRIGDRHNWKSAYYDRWWARAEFKLQKKNRLGIWRTKETVGVKRPSSRFQEQGVACIPGWNPGGA